MGGTVGGTVGGGGGGVGVGDTAGGSSGVSDVVGGVGWRGVVWCGVVWCGVVWCGVVCVCVCVWCGVCRFHRFALCIICLPTSPRLLRAASFLSRLCSRHFRNKRPEYANTRACLISQIQKPSKLQITMLRKKRTYSLCTTSRKKT